MSTRNPTPTRWWLRPLSKAARDGEHSAKVPWHFWLLLAAVVIYLGWRLIQGVEWLLG